MTYSPLLPERWQELIAGYALDDLSAEEIEELEQILANHPELRSELYQYQEILPVIPYGLPQQEPPAHLRSAILDEIVAQNLERPQTVAKRQFSWGKAMGVAAAIAIAALGINNYRLWQALQAVRPGTQFEQLTFSLQNNRTAQNAYAQVIVNPNNLEAELTVKDLPPLPPGKVYVLWTVLKQDAPFTTDSKGAILTEVFEVDARGNVSRTIAVPEVFRSRDLVSKVAITIEDAASPQIHEGKPILITKL